MAGSRRLMRSRRCVVDCVDVEMRRSQNVGKDAIDAYTKSHVISATLQRDTSYRGAVDRIF